MNFGRVGCLVNNSKRHINPLMFPATCCTMATLQHTLSNMLLQHVAATNVAYSFFTFSWPRFKSGSLRNGGMLVLRIFAGLMMTHNSIVQLQNCSTCFTGCLPREEAALYLLQSAVLAMPRRGKRANSTGKTIIYNVISIFRRKL